MTKTRKITVIHRCSSHPASMIPRYRFAECMAEGGFTGGCGCWLKPGTDLFVESECQMDRVISNGKGWSA